MSSTTDPFRQAAEADAGTYPKSWIPDPGDFIIGTLDHYDTGTSRFGPRTIAVIRDEDNDELRSVWLMASVLESKFRELEPKPGSRLYIKRHADRVNTAGTKYQSYSVKIDGQTTVPRFDRATEVPPDQKAETLEDAALDAAPPGPGPAPVASASKSFEDFPEALDDDDDDDLPF